MKLISSFKVVLIIVLSLFSWQNISAQKSLTIGNGKVTEHPVPIPEYTNLEFEANADLYYELRPDLASDFKMEIDENLIPFVTVELKKDKLTRKERLVIKTTVDIKPTKFVIYTNSRAIKDIDINGSGNVFMEEEINTKDLNVEMKGFGSFKAEKLMTKSMSLEVSGAGSGLLKGTSQSLELKIGKKGSGSIDASGLAVEEVKCDISGSGSMNVDASKSLEIKIDGSGSVTYKTLPRIYSHKLSGTGKVQQAVAE